jgi:hypothetical protein
MMASPAATGLAIMVPRSPVRRAGNSDCRSLRAGGGPGGRVEGGVSPVFPVQGHAGWGPGHGLVWRRGRLATGGRSGEGGAVGVVAAGQLAVGGEREVGFLPERASLPQPVSACPTVVTE